MSQLLTELQRKGRTPQVRLEITPLNSRNKVDPQRDPVHLTQFLSYQFTSSILVPVDAFSFTFAMPNTTGSLESVIQEGDIAELYAGETIICTGIVDVVEIDTTIESGDIVTIHGRNLLGQLEDSSAVNSKNKPIFGNNVPLATAVGTVIQKTRIRGMVTQGVPVASYMFGTEPGETKLSALSRFVEPLNCLIWSTPDGFISVGKPNMAADSVGSIVCARTARVSNVLSIKATRASTQIPNSVLPMWSGQEKVQERLEKQVVYNPAEGPARLRVRGHFVQRSVVTSTPQGGDPQSFSDQNALKAYGSDILGSYAAREIAHANIQELVVQANFKGHFNDDLKPYLIDQTYDVNYERAGVTSKMYVYQVDYSCDTEHGPRTTVHLCLLGRIVANISKTPYTKTVINSSSLPTL